MIDVLFFADKDVRKKLFERVDGSRGLLLVTATRHSKFMNPVPEREPFAALEREHGAFLKQVIVADEGTLEGMWRDPVGDLADALYPNDPKRSYEAASGYVLFKDGAVADVVKKHGAAGEDAWSLRESLSRLDARVPRPGPRKAKPAAPPPPATEAPPATLPEADPWRMLGIPPGTPAGEAKKIFRALISQYHPDKVAHLAPEFRQLAEQRTRQILEAWEAVERELE